MLNQSPPVARISLPSKGRLAEDSLAFLQACGLTVYKPNPRQYEAVIPTLPGLKVLFQRPADIVVSVRNGSVDFGISGMDVIEERRGSNGDVLVLHDALGYGGCSLAFAVPEEWDDVTRMNDLVARAARLGRPLGVATKYPILAGRRLEKYALPYTLISAEGTLETAPAIGYADLICDVVSSGQTLRDNHLRLLEDGVILQSQASLIANRGSLQTRPQALEMARVLLEYFEAHLRASGNLSVYANIRGQSPETVAQQIFTHCNIRGLQGPTISRVIVAEGEQCWYDANLIVPRDQLFTTIQGLRAAGGSGVVVLPVTYIFDEEPPRYKAMLAALAKED
ncbi:ATP phosphoribosyltransferase [Longilinea arvoryzae]|uniref:ATP phosphoribosyltransferase n=1 Tax=Longilinea arvoryzae TaxID=360412 RepID=A0A0S7BL77_9CHLR|nr:ATP phosphoribosyltransferase [Longilinea arvoryzae]GAP15844.1 ATP phosphoribosyltransferase [Longilinea arvoryzae]